MPEDGGYCEYKCDLSVEFPELIDLDKLLLIRSIDYTRETRNTLKDEEQVPPY